jgi:hypothetical protein
MYFEPHDLSRRNPTEHDILVVRRNRANRQYFRLHIDKPKDVQGNVIDQDRVTYTHVEEHLPSDAGYRATVGLACSETLHAGAAADATVTAPRGPVIAALPLHPNPTASAGCTCYLVNPENLTYETSWTHEEWNDQSVQPPENEVRDDDAIELLIATAAGRVYLLTKGDRAPAGSPPPPVPLLEIDLRRESELWNLLRNGCVAGSVRLVTHPSGQPRVVPVVNVEALAPSPLAPSPPVQHAS